MYRFQCRALLFSTRSIGRGSDISFKETTFLLEPIVRNTAPAIALACFALEPEEIVLVAPSDYFIKNETGYIEVVQKAKELAKEGYLATFGIIPSFTETGFSYIEVNGFDIKAFPKKPDKETAEAYLEVENYHWNSGMFCFKVNTFLQELKQYAPKYL